MTIENRNLNAVYDAAKEGELYPPQFQWAAELADKSMSKVMDNVKEHSSFKTAGDDRARNLELEIFRYICESNDLDWAAQIDIAWGSQ